MLGHAVAVSGRRVLVGEPIRTVGKPGYQGVVSGYDEPRAGWHGSLHPTTTFHARNGKAGDYFGDVLDIDRNVVVIGAPHTSPLQQPVKDKRAAAYIFSG